MPISLTLTYEDEWVARLAPMINHLAQDMQRHPVVLEALAAHGKESVDELTTKQKAKLVIHFYLMVQLNLYEGDEAERASRQAVTNDIETNFPVEVEDD